MTDVSELVEKGYDKIARDYYTHRDLNKFNSELDKFISLLPKNAHVLDVGCGAGIPTAKYLVQRNLDVTGIDISDVMINMAKENVPNVNFIKMDMNDLKFGESGSLVATKQTIQQGSVRSSLDGVKLMKDLRSISNALFSKKECFIFDPNFMGYEIMKVFVKETVISLVSAFLVVFLIVLLMLAHFSTSVYVMLTIGLVDKTNHLYRLLPSYSTCLLDRRPSFCHSGTK